MRTDDKRVKEEKKNCLVYLFGFIPILRITIITNDKYIVRKYWLFCFIPFFSTERLLPTETLSAKEFGSYFDV